MANTIKHKGYIGSVNYSSEDNVLFGKIEGINDLVNFQGATADEIKESFIESVDDYLETCIDIGKTPDKVYQGVFNVRINPELHREASFCAVEMEESFNSFIGKAIETFVELNKSSYLGRMHSFYPAQSKQYFKAGLAKSKHTKVSPANESGRVITMQSHAEVKLDPSNEIYSNLELATWVNYSG